MFEIVKNTNIDFIGKKYVTFIVSGTFIILSLIAIFNIARGSANLGIDFVGGTTVQVRFEKPVTLQEVRTALEEGRIKDVDLQDIPAENKVLIKTKVTDEELNNIAEVITTALETKLTDNTFIIDSTTAIGPKVGNRLRKDAVWAIIMAAIGILVYIAIRFHFQFGIGATLATFHDALAVLAIFYVLDKEINLIVVSALLTIAGYSLTDTVVVYDRIRENLRIHVKEPVKNVINKSLNEVLSRTVITSITTFLAAAALFFLGGEVIHDFAFAIMMGIIIGTYSSIFVASPVLLLWKAKRPFEKK
jgi:preprotein translocase subunit SecF